MTLSEQVKAVAQARKTYAELQKLKDAAYATWAETNKDLLNNVGVAQTMMTQAEADLREAALAEYRETGNARPIAGVQVKIFLELAYDPKEALKWAKEHFLAIALDRKEFESIAKSSPHNIEGLVRFTEVPRVQIATDLDKALEGVADART